MLRRALLIALALFVAVGTVAVARHWLAGEQAALLAQLNASKPKPAPAPTEKILVAAADVPAGTLLQKKHLRWQAWPKTAMAEGYVVDGGERGLEDFTGAVGRSGLLAGQPITDRLVVYPGDRGFLAAVLSPRMRAVTVPVNATTGIAGFVFPGDRVDLILTHAVRNDPNSRARRASETVLNDVRVIAVDQKVDDQNGRAQVAKTATLEVTPKQAELVAMLTDIGRLSLSLRSIVGEDLAEAKGGDSMLPRPPRRSRTLTLDSEVSLLLRPPSTNRNTDTVRVWRGGEAQDLVFQRR